MKSKYCLIRLPESAGLQAYVYHVWCGTSQREQMYLSWFKEYCRKEDLFFELWDNVVDDYLTGRYGHFICQLSDIANPWFSVHLTISDAFRIAWQKSWESFDASQILKPSAIPILLRYHPQRIARANKCRVIQLAHPIRRKNLSLG